MKLLTTKEIENIGTEELSRCALPYVFVLWNICHQLARIADKLSSIEHLGLKTKQQ